jgi:glycosyltransferase involved in cell wall biosynthesis
MHYGAEGSDLEDSAEHIQIISQSDQDICFESLGKNGFYNLDWSGKSNYWKITNDRAIKEINKRKQKDDFLCLIAGHLHKPIVDGTDLIPVEYGIGYFGTFAPYRVFESYAHMHHVIGKQTGRTDANGSNYDVVIPNYFNPRDYQYCEKKDNYYLYMGRMIQRKGVRIAVETCKAIGAKLILAGQGATQIGNKILANDGEIYEGDNLEYIGVVMGEERAQLLSKAKALFTPTIYIEPFGGVAVEAQMSGTPVISSDWGAFTETVEHGKTGYRCRTFDQYVWAAQHLDLLSPQYIYDYAIANYSIDRIRYQYQEYFEMLQDLRTTGWYTQHPERTQLDWLRRY